MDVHKVIPVFSKEIVSRSRPHTRVRSPNAGSLPQRRIRVPTRAFTPPHAPLRPHMRVRGPTRASLPQTLVRSPKRAFATPHARSRPHTGVRPSPHARSLP